MWTSSPVCQRLQPSAPEAAALCTRGGSPSRQVDLVLAEVVGTYATEEGCYHTIRDAHARHVKAPTRRDSWIPHTRQTHVDETVPCALA